MVNEPMSPSVMQSYRDALSVNGAPSFIDSALPITPVSIVSGTVNATLSGATSQKQLVSLTGYGAAAATTTLGTVTAGKTWYIVGWDFWGVTSGTPTVTLRVNGTVIWTEKWNATADHCKYIELPLNHVYAASSGQVIDMVISAAGTQANFNVRYWEL